MDIKRILFGGKAAVVPVQQYSKSTQKWLPVLDTKHGIIITKDGTGGWMKPQQMAAVLNLEQHVFLAAVLAALKVREDTWRPGQIKDKGEYLP